MNILILHKHLVVGGTERILISMLTLLKQLGHHTELMISHDLGKDNFFLEHIPAGIPYAFVFNQETYSHFNRQREQLASKRKNSFSDQVRYELFKLKEQRLYNQALNNRLKSLDYDLIIDFSGCLDKFIRLPKWLRGSTPPTLRWVHGQLYDHRHAIPRKLYKRYTHVFARHSRIVSLCQDMTDHLAALFGLPENRLATLPNPIDLTDIQTQAGELSALEEIENIGPYILQVARLDKGKGHEQLIDIYRSLKNQGVRHKLCIIGEGENRPALEALIAEHGLQNDCLLLGKRNNPYPYFKHAHIFVHTSEREGLPTVLLESMACGTPVVAMDCPTGPKDILGSDSRHGCLIPLHDSRQFADTVIQLLDNPQVHRHYVQQSLQRAQDFSLDTVAGDLDKLLHETLSAPAPK